MLSKPLENPLAGPKTLPSGKPKLRLVELTPLEREFLPPLLEIQETPPSPVKRAVLWIVIALMIGLTAWSCIGEIEVVSSAPGKFIPDGRIKVVQPMETSVVRAIHVKEGQHVKRGDLLLELDPTLNLADLSSNTERLALAEMDAARLKGEMTNRQPAYQTPQQHQEMVALQESLRAARQAAYFAKLSEAQADLRAKESQLASAEATLKRLQETLVIATEKESRARPYVEVAITRFDYLKLKQDLVSNQNDLTAQEKTIEQLAAARLQAEHKVREVQQEHQAEVVSDLNARASTIASLKGDTEKARQMLDLKTIKSPVDGWVQAVNVATAGGVVTAAQPLVSIVPEGTPLIVEAELSNEDIGFVTTGQRVEIKLDTFPFQKYGTVKGTVIWISPDAEDKRSDENATSGTNSSAAGSTKAATTYRVRIRPDVTTMRVDASVRTLTAGMSVTADIVTDHRRVIDFFISPMLKYLDEGSKVR